MRKNSFRHCKHIVVVFLVVIAGLFLLEGVWAQTVKFRIITANPSSIRRQRVPIKVYLPEEVKPEDIMDLGGLALEFDPAQSLYYVFKDDLYLDPSKVSSFEVEIKDIWLIPRGDLDGVSGKVETLLKAFEGSEYQRQMEDIAKEFEDLSIEILRIQSDDALSRSQHIGVYRTNNKAFVALKDKLVEMERILQRETGPLTPEMLAKTKFKTETPTKTATWIAIFAIIIFMGLISVIVFITWYRQGKATEKILSEAKKQAFLDLGGKEKEKEK